MSTPKSSYQSLRSEITKRAHSIEPQGDGITMVLIRMDEIIAAVKAYRRKQSRRISRCKTQSR